LLDEERQAEHIVVYKRSQWVYFDDDDDDEFGEE
jgi:hypothetical protein